MCKGLWTDPPSGHLLQTVISHSCRSADGALHITLFQKFALLSGVRPYSGQAIGLKLQLDRQVVSFLRIAAHERRDFLLNTHQLLYMMPNLMGQDVSLGELTGCSKTTPEFVVKSQVDIDLFVCRAVERAGSGTR